MNTDNFNEAAEAASWEDDRHPDDTGAWSRMKFMRGVEWARTHLAAQEPTDAEVRSAAFALAVEGEDIEEWDSLSTYGQAMYLRDARAALSAARTARRDEELPDGRGFHFSAPLDYLNQDRRDEGTR